MTRIGYVIATVLAADLFTALFAIQHWHEQRPRLLWNASASAPVGLYRVTTIDRPGVGDLVAILPPPRLARLMATRGYLPRGVPLVKRIAGVPGTRVCRGGTVVTLGQDAVAIARARDAAGRELPVWRGCRTVGKGELFLLNPAADSFDGRYFGPIDAHGLLGRAIPMFTRETAQTPLRWHGWRGRTETSPLPKGASSCR